MLLDPLCSLLMFFFFWMTTFLYDDKLECNSPAVSFLHYYNFFELKNKVTKKLGTKPIKSLPTP